VVTKDNMNNPDVQPFLYKSSCWPADPRPPGTLRPAAATPREAVPAWSPSGPGWPGPV